MVKESRENMYAIGLDVGTTGTKALVVDKFGKVFGYGYQGYETIYKSDGVVEQEAEKWWSASVYAIREACKTVDKSKIKAISLSTQGASSVLVDGEFQSIGNAITWMDKRAYQEVKELLGAFGDEYFYKKSGWGLSANLDACKLLWLTKHRTEDLERAYKFISTLEYMNYCLVGKYVIDPTNAAIRQLMDVKSNQWEKEILDYIGVEEQLLPDIKKTGEYLGPLCDSAALGLGLSTQVKVYNGAHDQYCCALGSGSVKNGDLLLGTGTAWVIMSVTEKPLFTDTKISPARHVIPDLWGALSSISCGGISLDWWKNKITQLNYDEIDRFVEENMAQDMNLMFFPYFNGAGTPLCYDNARGTFTGLELRHTANDMALSIMEGVVFHTALIIEEYKRNGAKIGDLRIMGGAVKSKPWIQILQSVLDCRIVKVNQTDAAAMGAAIIAAVGCGMQENYQDAVESMVSYQMTEEIPESLKLFYHMKFEKYKKQWEHIKEIYKEEGEINDKSMVS